MKRQGWSSSMFWQRWLRCGTYCAQTWKRTSQQQSGCVSRGFQRDRQRQSNQGLDGDRRLMSLVMTGACLSSKEERVVLYAIKREPSDSAVWVMRLDNFRSLRNELISIRWNRQKEWSVGGGRGEGFMESVVKTGNDLMESSVRKRETGQVSSQKRLWPSRECDVCCG